MLKPGEEAVLVRDMQGEVVFGAGADIPFAELIAEITAEIITEIITVPMLELL